MPARLIVNQPFRPTLTLLARDGGRYVVGRDGDCDLVVDDDRVSRRHARLEPAPAGGWQIADLGSKNGTAVNGRASDLAPLEDGALISFGGVLAGFRVLSDEAVRQLESRRAGRWQTSLALQRELTAANGVGPLLTRLVDSVLRVSGAERGFVMLRGRGGELRIEASSGIERADLESREFSGSVGVVDRVLAEGRAVTSSDALQETILGARPSIAMGGIRAVVCVPLLVLERLIGVLYADSRKPGASFEQLDLDILEALASHAALALAVSRVDDELRHLAAALPADAPSPPADFEELLERSLHDLPAAGAAAAERPTWGDLTARHRVESAQ